MVTTKLSRLAEAEARRDGAAKALAELEEGLEGSIREQKQVLGELGKSYPFGDGTPERLMLRRDELVALMPRLRERIGHAKRTLMLEQGRFEQVESTVRSIQAEIAGYRDALEVHQPAKRLHLEASLAGMSPTVAEGIRRGAEELLAEADVVTRGIQMRLEGAENRLRELIGEEPTD